jgi:tetratricopeptide (TPR) repeat protein
MRRELERADLHQVQSRLCHEALELLAHRAREPLILLVEDIHRADAQLRSFIARLETDSASGVDTARLAVVATALPPVPAQSAEQNFSPPAGRTLRLEPLQLADVAAVLESVRPGADRADAKRLLEATGGHAGLLARRLREGLNAEAQPPRSSQALRDRIAKLDGAARKLCLVLSLLDHPVARDRLTVLSGLGGKDLAASRRVLEGLGLAGGSRDVCYLQADAATACLERCDPDAVRAARVALGRTLLQRCRRAGRSGPPAAAGGGCGAGHPCRPQRRAEASGSGAPRRGGVAPSPRLPPRGPMASSSSCWGISRTNVAASTRPRRRTGKRSPSAACAEGSARDSSASSAGRFKRRGASAEARSRFEEALASLSSRDADERLRILRELAGLELFSGDPEASVRIARQGLEVLDSAAGSRLDRETKRFHAFQMHTTLGNVHLRRFEYERAADELSLALRLADEAESASSAALILNLLASPGIRRTASTRRCVSTGVRRLWRSVLGDSTALFSVYCNVAAIQARLGDFTSAESTLRRAESLPLAARSDRARLYLLHSRGLVQRLLLEDSRSTWEEVHPPRGCAARAAILCLRSRLPPRKRDAGGAVGGSSPHPRGSRLAALRR